MSLGQSRRCHQGGGYDTGLEAERSELGPGSATYLLIALSKAEILGFFMLLGSRSCVSLASGKEPMRQGDLKLSKRKKPRRGLLE
jgi:hypothetical protein